MLPVKRESTVPAKSAFARARERFTARQEERRRETRIGFIVDATGSRHATWEQAQTIQATMFRSTAKLSALSLRLVHFGGNLLTDHGWMSDPRAVAAQMAGVHCWTGTTQIVPALRAFTDENPESRANALILIGDCFEESQEDALSATCALKSAGIRVFSFLEGKDWTAETVFRRLAEETGGKFARFGEDLPLGALCEGVALLTAGGNEAVKRLGNKKVRLLLTGPAGKQS
jgi:hypothetical protein